MYCRKSGWIHLLALTALLAGIAGLWGCASDEEKKADHFQKGKVFFEQKEYKKAELELRNAIKLAPKFADAHELLGETYLKLGQPKEAFREYSQLEVLSPDNLEAKRKLATFFFLGKNLEEAQKRVDAVLARHPEDLEMLFLLAGIRGQGNEPDTSIPILETIIEKDPGQTRAYLSLAQIYSRKRDFENAEANLKKAVETEPDSEKSRLALFSLYISHKKFDEAEAVIRNLVESKPEEPDYRIMLANFYFRQRENGKAEAEYRKAAEIRPDDLKPYLALAGFYKALNQKEKELDVYEEALKIHPDDVNVLTALAEYHLNQGRKEKAAAYVAQALEKNPKHFPARMHQGKILILDHKFAEAVDLFSELTQEEPRSDQAHYFMGLGHFRNGDIQLAKSSILEAEKLNPNNPKTRLLLAEIHYRDKDFPQAETESRAVLEKISDHYRAVMILGNSCMYQRKLDEARDAFESLTVIDPENPAGYFRLGLLQRLQKQPDEAMKNFRKALDINPKLLDVFTHTILLHASLRQFDTALEKCDSQLNLMGDEPKAAAMILSLKGDLLLASGKLTEAEAAFRASLEKNSDAVKPYFALARIYMREKKTDRAIAQYRALLEKNPDQAAPHMLLGTIFDMQAKKEDAETHYREALKVKPDFAPAANNLAYLLAEAGKNLNEALGLAQKAKEAFPDDPSIMDTLGWVYYKKELYPQAIRELTDSVRKLPDNAVIHYHLGLAYLKNEDRPKAAETLSRALELNESFNGAEEARKLLSEIR